MGPGGLRFCVRAISVTLQPWDRWPTCCWNRALATNTVVHIHSSVTQEQSDTHTYGHTHTYRHHQPTRTTPHTHTHTRPHTPTTSASPNNIQYEHNCVVIK